ncbi:hypothetical protein N5079_07765 [Planotetraspora sp. A-T 1434]|uniref:hypothetical protein n=1 Tax=Planotetraspora sp. A-T 1434 TaxID=2979219 RepID=UPI0021C24D03|nr:hypothetical protein [Planotetraspora sp. A-T 1434]MCT9930119.1 hypothetical protein [Planotetraspora sp. A-T 1434]
MRALGRCAAAVPLGGLLCGLLCALTGAGPPDPLLPEARAIIREHPGMWAQASVARGEHTIVVGGPRRLVADLSVLADRASRTVARVWGPVDAVVLVPATAEQAEVLAAPARVEGLAALAGVGRVIIEPDGFARLTPTGRQVVLAHELVHVATGAAVTGDLPAWLVEGFADYVGYLGSGLSARTVAAELAAEVRAGALPRELPGRADFRAGSARLAQAYEEAWLVCRYIAGRFGERKLVKLYRAALRHQGQGDQDQGEQDQGEQGQGEQGQGEQGQGEQDQGDQGQGEQGQGDQGDRDREGIAPALWETLGITQAELTRDWLASLPEQLGIPTVPSSP